jgi:hypothetical protein
MDDRHETRVERDGWPESPPSIIVSQGEFSPMLKTLTFSLSLAVALGFCSMSKAGGLDPNCKTCGLASPQASVYPSGQGVYAPSCEVPCAPKHSFSFHLPEFHCPKITLPKFSCPKIVHSTSYEWVLKKKINISIVHTPHEECAPACGPAPVYPTGQVAPSSQGVVAPTTQASSYAAPQVFGAGQQNAFQPARPATIASVTEMTPAVRGGEEAPPAPEVRETSAIGAPNGGLLLPTPSGN